MKKSTAITIGVTVIFVIIFGGVTITEINKQNNDKAIADAKIQIEKAALDYQKEKDRQAEADKAYAKLMINACIEDAEDNYWNYAELNGTGKRDDVNGVTMAQYKWDIAEERKEKDIDNCYRKYNQ